MSFEADAETLSLFSSLDFQLDETCQKIREDNEIVSAGMKETTNQETTNSDEQIDEDEDEEEEEAEDDEEDEDETAASLVHSVEPTTGEFYYLIQ